MGGAAHMRVIIITGLAGMLFGFDTAVIAGATATLREVFVLTPAGLGAAVSSALWHAGRRAGAGPARRSHVFPGTARSAIGADR
jgi:hypothetical protein